MEEGSEDMMIVLAKLNYFTYIACLERFQYLFSYFPYYTSNTILLTLYPVQSLLFKIHLSTRTIASLSQLSLLKML